MASAGAAVLGGCRMLETPARRFDDNLSVFVSDIHVLPDSYQRDRFAKVVDEILAMDPLPRNVVCFGDVAWVYGTRADYETSRPLLKRLVDAGISLTLGMGNHDHRRNFLDAWPEYADRTLVPGRITTRVNLGHCDLILLDTLWEDHLDETRMCKVSGEIDGTQFDWLKAEIANLTRPTFVAAHHPADEMEKGDGAAFIDLMMSSPAVVGYLHGHKHVWSPKLMRRTGCKWGDSRFKRVLGLPSTGHWGDIGHVVFRTFPGAARADLVENDHFFPNPDAKTWIDEEMIRERQGLSCTFRWT